MNGGHWSAGRDAFREATQTAMGWDEGQGLEDMDSLDAYRLLVVLEDLVGQTLPDRIVAEHRTWQGLFDEMRSYENALRRSEATRPIASSGDTAAI